jgi:uroporphyrinogen decarboxylase
VNGRERILAAFRGEAPDCTPVMLHNFMMAAAEAGVSMAEFRRNPRATADAFLRAVEKYGYDGIMMDIDTMTLAEAAGVPADHPDDAPARAAGARLQSLSDVDTLGKVDLAGCRRVQVWLEAVRLLQEGVGGEILIRGNCDQASYSLAALIRGPEAWMMDLLDPEAEEGARALLEYTTELHMQFLSLMAQAGADMLSSGDSLSGPDVISPKLYAKFAQPYEARIAAHAHALGLPYVLHICGKTDKILPGMIETGADGLELDYKTDVRLANSLVRDKAVFVGNIDPSAVLANGTVEDVRTATRALLTVFRGNPRFVLNAGCAIPATTPPENLRALIETGRA